MILICFQGFVYPSIYTLLGVWAPPNERGRLTSFALGGEFISRLLYSLKNKDKINYDREPA